MVYILKIESETKEFIFFHVSCLGEILILKETTLTLHLLTNVLPAERQLKFSARRCHFIKVLVYRCT